MSDRGTWLSDSRGRRLPHGSWPPTRAADEPLELVRQFVNTRNLHNGADLLGTVGEMRTWLQERGLSAAGLNRAELHELHALRSVLHRLAVHNGDATEASDAWSDLTAIAARHPLTLRFGDGVSVGSTGPGIERFVARLLAIVAGARVDGSWPLLKACHDVTCRWVIFDRSKNRSAGWCSAGTCGGKARARTYRARALASAD